MNLDFSFKQHMRMSFVKRWVIIEMSRAQSVAEHSFNVAVIANGLLDKMAINILSMAGNVAISSVRADVLEWALMHDLPELFTGDLPTPVKRHMRKAIDGLEDAMFPGYGRMRNRMEDSVAGMIVKLADDIDAIQFARRFCIDPEREEIIGEMVGRMNKRIEEGEKKYGIPVRKAVEAVWQD